jgi:hypothetical protein
MTQNAVVMEQTVNAPAINVENNVENVLANMEANTPAISLDLSFTAMNKALGAVFTETMKFKQALRVFDGMGSLMVPISDKKKMKFSDILGQVGVEYKAGRIDVESLKPAWKVFTEDGYMAIYRGVPGYEATEGDEKGRKVYTWDEKKSQYMGVSVQKIVAVEKWNAPPYPDRYPAGCLHREVRETGQGVYRGMGEVRGRALCVRQGDQQGRRDQQGQGYPQESGGVLIGVGLSAR